jgi:hypothetical protein
VDERPADLAEGMRATDAGVSRPSLVVIQQATERLTPMNPVGASTKREPLNKPIFEPLMISFAMVVIDEFLEGPSEAALTEWHDPIEALVLNRPHEPFSMGLR